MKKIISAMAMACLSFSCFAEDYFIKIAKDEYVLQHVKASKDLGTYDIGIGRPVAAVDAVYTPTHIFTYPDGTPAHFRNIQKIDYTESNVTFYKDIKSRKCCIDIYDDEKNPNKCRIIGVDGHNYDLPMYGNIEIYKVSDKENSFTDSTPRLIYVDHTGLYIVSEKENPLKIIFKNCTENKDFNFKGEVIKISAIDGKREVTGINFNYQNNVSTPFVESSEFTPVMEQIEKITGIRPKTAPPSEESALKRMAEILDVPEELLVIEDGKVFIVDTRAAAVPGQNVTKFPASLYGLLFNSYVLELKKFISVKGDLKQSILTKAYRKIISLTGHEGQKTKEYIFDTSDEAKKRRKEIALKPWDE
ncbi:MAG: hypothetical protein J6P84_05680 [Alphaproteobacteria bacterium]|nr:hypothetical protein [Alphaproteobacteria bacterium]